MHKTPVALLETFWRSAARLTISSPIHIFLIASAVRPFLFKQPYRPIGISPMGNSGRFPRGKASCDRIAQPSLRCMLGVLVFPEFPERWHGLQDLLICTCDLFTCVYTRDLCIYSVSFFCLCEVVSRYQKPCTTLRQRSQNGSRVLSPALRNRNKRHAWQRQ